MTIHRLNAYKDGHIWITYCEHCGKEADELLGSKCTGKVETIMSDLGPQRVIGIDKPSIDDYVARLIADNGN